MHFAIINFIPLVASGEGGGTLLDVNPGLIFWTVITFVLLLLLLRKIAWKPILSALDLREKEIRDSLEKAEKAKEEAQKILEANQANLSKAEDEAKKIIEQTRTYAANLKEQLTKESKEQAKKIIDDASAEIQRRKDAAFDELKGQIAEIAVNAAEKIMRENLDANKNKKIVDEYLKDVSKN
jgi:F-type H+-transporting ATPase subunit b